MTYSSHIVKVLQLMLFRNCRCVSSCLFTPLHCFAMCIVFVLYCLVLSSCSSSDLTKKKKYVIFFLYKEGEIVTGPVDNNCKKSFNICIL